MALLFLESFNGPHIRNDTTQEHLVATGSDTMTQVANKCHGYNNWLEANSPTNNSPVGFIHYQSTGNSFGAGDGVRANATLRAAWGVIDTWILGVAFKPADNYNATTAADLQLLGLVDVSDNKQITVYLVRSSTSGWSPDLGQYHLEVRRGATVLYTSPVIQNYESADLGLDDMPAGFLTRSILDATLIQSQWHYVEFKCTVDPVVGAFTLNLDGVQLDDQSGINTADQGTTGADSFEFAAFGSAQLLAGMDDFYACDTTGAANNDFLGKIVIVEKWVNADGFYTDWTPVGYGTNYQPVADVNAVNDVQYNESDTVGHQDSFTYPAMPRGVTGPLIGAQITLRGALSVGGDRDISPLWRTAGGTDYTNSDFLRVVGPSFVSKPFIYELNPDTAAAWTIADFNAGQWGFELIA